MSALKRGTAQSTAKNRIAQQCAATVSNKSRVLVECTTWLSWERGKYFTQSDKRVRDSKV